MAVVIIAAAQEEVRSSLMQESPNREEDEVDGWVKQVEERLLSSRLLFKSSVKPNVNRELR